MEEVFSPAIHPWEAEGQFFQVPFAPLYNSPSSSQSFQLAPLFLEERTGKLEEICPGCASASLPVEKRGKGGKGTCGHLEVAQREVDVTSILSFQPHSLSGC